MKSLADLPSDVIGQILFGKFQSYLVVELWKCGNHRLQLKLQDAIIYMDLKEPTNSPFPSRFPSMLSWLPKLRYLSVARGCLPLMPTARELRHELSRLSCASKLEELLLESDDFELLYALDSACGYAEDPTIDSVEPRFFDLKSRFSSLRTLELSSLATSFFSHLPDSITKLTTVEVLWNAESKGLLASLPRSLQILDAAFEYRSASYEPESVLLPALPIIWADPPPSLRYITSWSAPDHVLIVDFSFLPRTLEHCDLSRFLLSIAALATIPPLLDSITISIGASEPSDSTLSHKWLPFMPSQLKELKVDVEGFYLDYNFLANLPRTLEKLFTRTSRADWKEIGKKMADHHQLLFWPPHLNELQLYGHDWDFCPDLLPSTLTILAVPWPYQSSSSKAASVTWPPQLVSLKIRLYPTQLDPFTMRIEKCEWPLALKFLELKGKKSSFMDGFSLSNLPQSLETLHLRTPIAAAFLSGKALEPFTLPAGLKELHTKQWSSALFAVLPRSLTHLDIETLKFGVKFSRKTSTDSKGPIIVEENESNWDMLPPDLCCFQISFFTSGHEGCDELTALSGRFLSRLKRLHTLDLWYLSMEASALRYFSTTIRCVQITLQNLTPELGPFINRLWRDSEISLRMVRWLSPSSMRESSKQAPQASYPSSSPQESNIMSLSDHEAFSIGNKVLKEYWHYFDRN